MSLLPILVLFILFFLNVPVAFALILSTAVYFLFVSTGVPVDVIFQRMVASTESFPLLAVPFFVTAGCMMNYAGISSRLMNMADVLTGHMKGGLAQVNVVLSMFMGGVSGSASADAAMDCKILVPEMAKRGYDAPFSAAITAASAIITPIIPPGIGLILYAFLANQSVGKMFLAGYIPGLLLTVSLMIGVNQISKKRGYLPSRDRRATLKEIMLQLKDSIWALAMPFGIIMGLRFGVFTPTEAGAIAVLFSMAVGFFVYKELKIKHLPQVLLESALATSAVMLIIVAASAFGYYMTWERLPQTISGYLISITDNPFLFLLIINLFLLIVGMFIEGTAALIILTPIIAPAAVAVGIDPIHFGIVVVLNLTIGAITPPFGSLVFLTGSVLSLSVIKIFKEIIPFIFIMIAILLLVTFFPDLVMFLPNLLMN